MSTKLILSAGVVQFKIIKTITAKILGTSYQNSGCSRCIFLKGFHH